MRRQILTYTILITAICLSLWGIVAAVDTSYYDSFEDGDLDEYSYTEDQGESVIQVDDDYSTDGNYSMNKTCGYGTAKCIHRFDYDEPIEYDLKNDTFRFDWWLETPNTEGDDRKFEEIIFVDPNGDTAKIRFINDTSLNNVGYRITGSLIDIGKNSTDIINHREFRTFLMEYNDSSGEMELKEKDGDLITSGALKSTFSNSSDITLRFRAVVRNSDSDADYVRSRYDNLSVGPDEDGEAVPEIDVKVLDDDSGVLQNREPVKNATVETYQDGVLIDSKQTNATGDATVDLKTSGTEHTLRVRYGGGGVRFLETDVYSSGDSVEARINLFPPELDNGSASPVGTVSPIKDGRDLKINVSDFDMPNENVTVEFYDYNSSATSLSDHDLIGTDVRQNDSQASVFWDALNDTETYSWFSRAYDEQPLTDNVTSQVFSTQQQSERPKITDVLPEDGSVVNNRTQELQVFVSDADANDNLTVEFYEFETGSPDQDTLLGTDTTRADGFDTTWTVPKSDFVGLWYVRINDSYGNVQLSSVYRFDIAGYLRIEDGNDLSLVDDRPVHVRFTQPGETINTSTRNGTLPLPALDLDPGEDITARVRASGFYEATFSIDSITGNTTGVIQRCPTYSATPSDPSDVDDCDPDNFSDRVVVEFTLQDNSGSFPPETTRLEIRGGINASKNETVLASSRFGAANSIVTSLAKDERFSLRVINKEGDARALGNILADANETIPLSVGQLELGIDDPGNQGYLFTANWKENDRGGERIRVQFGDPGNETNDAKIQIYERGNESNVLKTWRFARLGNFSGSVFIPPSQRDKTWVVELNADRGDGEINNKVVVGEGAIEPQIPLDQFWKQMIAIMGILMTAGLVGGGAQAELGAIASSLVAGMFYLIDWLPSSTTGGMIVLALFVAIAWRLRGPSPSGVR